MNLYQTIRNLCSQKGITIAELERELGFSNAQIRRWHNGRYPSADRLQKVADYFDVSIDYLMGNQKEHYAGEEISEDIRIMQRAAENMSEKDRQKALKIFETFFDNWEDIKKGD
ncbi:helix-turn-helix transcriptional regulator [Mammaliicoccus sciuri]|uniref:helix-turn-helix domain-containing protein n=1 Tax=Mammaliicoccus sciuri TaxID=1296 RepID=UPI003365292F